MTRVAQILREKHGPVSSTWAIVRLLMASDPRSLGISNHGIGRIIREYFDWSTGRVKFLIYIDVNRFNQSDGTVASIRVYELFDVIKCALFIFNGSAAGCLTPMSMPASAFESHQQTSPDGKPERWLIAEEYIMFQINVWNRSHSIHITCVSSRLQLYLLSTTCAVHLKIMV